MYWCTEEVRQRFNWNLINYQIATNGEMENVKLWKLCQYNLMFVRIFTVFISLLFFFSIRHSCTQHCTQPKLHPIDRIIFFSLFNLLHRSDIANIHYIVYKRNRQHTTERYGICESNWIISSSNWLILLCIEWTQIRFYYFYRVNVKW